MEEVWKTVEGYEGYYSISNLGRLRRNCRNGKTRNIKIPLCSHGYNMYRLSIFGNRKPFRIHKLVAQYFIGKPRVGQQVNHIDGNKLNNRVDNLEYVIPAENAEHAKKAGLYLVGEKSPSSKLTNKEVIQIRKEYLEGNTSHAKLARKFFISQPCIAAILTRKTWSHV